MVNESIIEIDLKNDSNLIEIFLSNAGKSLDTFRYFNSKKNNLINTHIVTCLLMKNNIPIGYGHLDLDNNVTWLGISIIENEINKGYGNKIMVYLINKAKILNIKKISLSVDKNNLGAINLYNKLGFKITTSHTNSIFLMDLIIDNE
jgi:hypothetical protein